MISKTDKESIMERTFEIPYLLKLLNGNFRRCDRLWHSSFSILTLELELESKTMGKVIGKHVGFTFTTFK